MHEERLAEIIIAKLEQKNPGFEFETEEVLARGKRRLGITIKNSYGVSPVVYMDDLFEVLREGSSTDELAELANDAFERAIKTMTEDEETRDFMQMVGSKGFGDENLSGRLMSEEELGDRANEYISRKVVEGLYLVVEACKDLDDGSMLSAILPKGTFKEDEEEEKIQIVLDNLAKEARLTSPAIGMDQPMYTLSNEGNVYGAACIFGTGVAEGLANDFRSDYYILPASKHEVMIAPTFGEYLDESEMKALIAEANSREDVVKPEDVLTNRLYKYENGKIKAV